MTSRRLQCRALTLSIAILLGCDTQSPPITWKSDGWPAIGGGSPGTTLWARPTGDPD